MPLSHVRTYTPAITDIAPVVISDSRAVQFALKDPNYGHDPDLIQALKLDETAVVPGIIQAGWTVGRSIYYARQDSGQFFVTGNEANDAVLARLQTSFYARGDGERESPRLESFQINFHTPLPFAAVESGYISDPIKLESLALEQGGAMQIAHKITSSRNPSLASTSLVRLVKSELADEKISKEELGNYHECGMLTIDGDYQQFASAMAHIAGIPKASEAQVPVFLGGSTARFMGEYLANPDAAGQFADNFKAFTRKMGMQEHPLDELVADMEEKHAAHIKSLAEGYGIGDVIHTPMRQLPMYTQQHAKVFRRATSISEGSTVSVYLKQPQAIDKRTALFTFVTGVPDEHGDVWKVSEFSSQLTPVVKRAFGFLGR